MRSLKLFLFSLAFQSSTVFASLPVAANGQRPQQGTVGFYLQSRIEKISELLERLKSLTVDARSSQNPDYSASITFTRKPLPLNVDLEPEVAIANATHLLARLNQHWQAITVDSPLRFDHLPADEPEIMFDLELADTFSYADQLRRSEYSVLLLLYGETVQMNGSNPFDLRRYFFPKFRPSAEQLMGRSQQGQIFINEISDLIRTPVRLVDQDFAKLLGEAWNESHAQLKKVNEDFYCARNRTENVFHFLSRAIDAVTSLHKEKRLDLVQTEHVLKQLSLGLRSSLIYAEATFASRKEHDLEKVEFGEGLNLNDRSTVDPISQAMGDDGFYRLYSGPIKDPYQFHVQVVAMQYLLAAAITIGQYTEETPLLRALNQIRRFVRTNATPADPPGWTSVETFLDGSGPVIKSILADCPSLLN